MLSHMHCNEKSRRHGQELFFAYQHDETVRLMQHDGLVLYYLGLRVRAEPLRYMLHYAGIQYTDVTIPVSEWLAVKPTMPQV